MDSRPVKGVEERLADRRSVGKLARSRGAVVVLLVAVLAGAAIRVAVQKRNAAAMADTYSNFLIAKSLLSGRGFATGGSEHPDVTRSVPFPIAIAAVTPLVGGVERATAVVVIFCGALLAIPMFLLVRSIFGPRAALASIPLAAFSCLVSASATLLATPLYLLFTMSTAACAWRAARRDRLRDWALVGALAGATALTRPEGLAMPLAFTAWGLLAGGRRSARPRALRGIAAAAIVIVASALVYAPYAAWSSARLGRLALAPPIGYLQAMREVSDHLGLRNVKSDVPWTERAKFALTEDHRDLYLRVFFLTGTFPDADRDVATAVEAPTGLSTVEQWKWVAKRRRNIALGNLVLAVRKAYWSHFLEPLTAALGAVGLIGALRIRRGRRALVLCLLIGIASLAPLSSHVEARFLFMPCAIGLVIAAAGWGVIARALAAARSPLRSWPWARVALHLTIAAAVAVAGYAHDGRDPGAGARADFLQAQGNALASSSDEPILAIAPDVPYWAGRPYRPIPFSDAAGILDYARAQGASRLVLEQARDIEARPDLAWLIADDRPAAFHLVTSAPHPNGGRLLVFEIAPALVSNP